MAKANNGEATSKNNQPRGVTSGREKRKKLDAKRNGRDRRGAGVDTADIQRDLSTRGRDRFFARS